MSTATAAAAAYRNAPARIRCDAAIIAYRAANGAYHDAAQSLRNARIAYNRARRDDTKAARRAAMDAAHIAYLEAIACRESAALESRAAHDAESRAHASGI